MPIQNSGKQLRECSWLSLNRTLEQQIPLPFLASRSCTGGICQVPFYFLRLPILWLLAILYGWTWIGNSLYLGASVVNRYALTQPPRHRGTEAIISAGPTHLIQRRANSFLELISGRREPIFSANSCFFQHNEQELDADLFAMMRIWDHDKDAVFPYESASCRDRGLQIQASPIVWSVPAMW